MDTSDAPQVETDYAVSLPGGTRGESTITSASASKKATSYTFEAVGKLDTHIDKDETGKVVASYDYTVRADGKRTSLTEMVWFDIGNDGVIYNLQGRIATVTNEGYTDGTLSSRERTRYEYDSDSYRVALVTEVDSALTNTYTVASSTEFLADHHNHTDYVQTIRETTVNADGSSTTTDYTFGHDEISQRTVTRNSSDVLTQDETLVFGHDGHGSVRVLYDLTGIIDQLATYAAYGAMLAVHNATGALVGTSESTFKSNLGYSGEQWDASLRMQNLRARPYDPRNGRFVGLDPFVGNMQDPQSLHKYAYVHGDPIQGIDPTGLEFSLGGLATTITITGSLGGLSGAGYGAAYAYVKGFEGTAFWRQVAISAAAGALIGAAVASGGYGLAYGLSAQGGGILGTASALSIGHGLVGFHTSAVGFAISLAQFRDANDRGDNIDRTFAAIGMVGAVVGGLFSGKLFLAGQRGYVAIV